MSPAKGHKGHDGLGALVLQEEAKKVGNVYPEEEKVVH